MAFPAGLAAAFLETDAARGIGRLLFSCDALFNTYCFLFLFLPIVLAGYWLVPRRGWKLAWITAASLVFYSFWNVRFVPLLVASAIVDFVVAQRIAACPEAPDKRRKRWLIASLVFNLGVLAVFKYAVWGADNARGLFEALGAPVRVPAFDIVLPVGISFYTFQTLSYTIDVYRGDVPPTRNFLKYVAYVTMFPQLVAGPIVRYRDMDAQLDAVPRRPRADLVVLGVSLFAIGLVKKGAIADPIAARVDPLWAQPGSLDLVTGWLAALGYTLQLYFDFSGYSDMAIGLGALLGFRFPVNFNAPYQALDPSDFWRRWHISLSSFLRDYLYIPLGGNRKGPRRTTINLALVMLLGGLWHGAAWTYVAWGGYHGLLLGIHRKWAAGWAALAMWAQKGLMFVLAVIGWVLFRAPDFATAGQVYAAMFTPAASAWHILWTPPVLAIFAAVAFTMTAKATAIRTFRPDARGALLAATLLLLGIVAMGSDYSPFLYYQF
ncbi:MAG: MBOAT family O-acyltransferase [Thermoplasmatota archaeon]